MEEKKKSPLRWAINPSYFIGLLLLFLHPFKEKPNLFCENWKNKTVQNVKVGLKDTAIVRLARPKENKNTLGLHSLSTQRIQNKIQANSGMSCSLREYGVGVRWSLER